MRHCMFGNQKNSGSGLYKIIGISLMHQRTRNHTRVTRVIRFPWGPITVEKSEVKSSPLSYSIFAISQALFFHRRDKVTSVEKKSRSKPEVASGFYLTCFYRTSGKALKILSVEQCNRMDRGDGVQTSPHPYPLSVTSC